MAVSVCLHRRVQWNLPVSFLLGAPTSTEDYCDCAVNKINMSVPKEQASVLKHAPGAKSGGPLSPEKDHVMDY